MKYQVVYKQSKESKEELDVTTDKLVEILYEQIIKEEHNVK